MERQNDLREPAIYLISTMYLAGLIGLNMDGVAIYFKFFTPIHLIFNLCLLIFFQRDRNKIFVIYSLIIFFAAFVIEWQGIKTGTIFGSYKYGRGLGLKLLDVPIIIGVNWLILIICSGSIIEKYFRFKNSTFFISNLIKAFLAAIIMTGLDIMIEPVAIYQDFWVWKSNIIPFQNYFAWFGISFIMLLFFYFLPFKKENPIAIWLYILQFLFFGAQLVVMNGR